MHDTYKLLLDKNYVLKFTCRHLGSHGDLCTQETSRNLVISLAVAENQSPYNYQKFGKN